MAKTQTLSDITQRLGEVEEKLACIEARLILVCDVLAAAERTDEPSDEELAEMEMLGEEEEDVL